MTDAERRIAQLEREVARLNASKKIDFALWAAISSYISTLVLSHIVAATMGGCR